MRMSFHSGFALILRANREAIDLRHHDVEQHEVGRGARNLGHGLLTVLGGSHLVTGLLHQELQRKHDVRLIVDDQHAWGFAHGDHRLRRTRLAVPAAGKLTGLGPELKANSIKFGGP